MIKILFTLNLIMLISQANAQSYTVEYEERANIENQLKNVKDPETRRRVTNYLSKPRSFYLYYSNGESLYMKEKNKLKDDELNIDGNKNVKKVDIGKDEKGIYKNHKTKTYIHGADVLGKKLLVTDVLEKYNWKIINEEKMIGDYKCKKAISKINNEDVVAWFSDEIPLQDGPKDYYGLPGLIIELKAEKKIYHAIKISKTKENIKITAPTKGTKVNKEEYHRILKKKIAELKKGFGNSLRR